VRADHSTSQYQLSCNQLCALHTLTAPNNNAYNTMCTLQLQVSSSTVESELLPDTLYMCVAACQLVCNALQLARILLQLQHTSACIAVCSRALADARAVADSLWLVQLLQLQANALAAQEEPAAALTCLRDGMAR
jgi:hypothetical protein